MIPKIIHYTWFSGEEMPQMLKDCMASWKRNLRGYEFRLWDKDAIRDLDSAFLKQALENKKWAFAADYVRLYAIYNYGGIYLDTDVEVLMPFDDFLDNRTMIGWQDRCNGLEVAAFGAEKGQSWVRDCLAYYQGRSFVREDGSFDKKLLPNIVEETLCGRGYVLEKVETLNAYQEKAGKTIQVFSSDFFSPKSYEDGKIRLTSNTRCIHHFAGSWQSKPEIILAKIQAAFNKLGIKGTGLSEKIRKLFDRKITN